MKVDNHKRRVCFGIGARRDVVKVGTAAKRSAIHVCQEIMSVWSEYGDAKPSADTIQSIYNEEFGDED